MIPHSNYVRPKILEFLKDGKPHTIRSVVENIANKFSVTEEDRKNSLQWEKDLHLILESFGQ